MSWVLIAVALSHGSAEPYFQHKVYTDRAECHAAASKYVKQAVLSEHRAFCMKVRNK